MQNKGLTSSSCGTHAPREGFLPGAIRFQQLSITFHARWRHHLHATMPRKSCMAEVAPPDTLAAQTSPSELDPLACSEKKSNWHRWPASGRHACGFRPGPPQQLSL
jgi:hypothetical protein